MLVSWWTLCSALLTPPPCVVDAPSSPVVTSVPQQDSIAFSWTQDDQFDVVESYYIVFEYNGPCSVTFTPIEGSLMQTGFDPMDLDSFSNYRLTVTAVNPVGSNTTVVMVTTLPSGETLIPPHPHITLTLLPPPHLLPPTPTHYPHTLTPPPLTPHTHTLPPHS